ncbi:hypothetical protein [Paraglaciecola sp. 2405UD69-4]|uniref:hypothetical protein n=1 Tax=Paraglaciecola sp. 2405UD69-4 TaxID=3391836 RepID=UPI0039C9082F
MKKSEVTEENNRSLFIKVIVVLVFTSLMLGIIVYLNKGSTNVRRVALENLADQFASSVRNAHWQWQGEGRPQIIMLITYANKLGENKQLIETSRKPIFMTHEGWPKAEPTSEGCAEIWDMALNMPMEVKGFKILAEYYDGVKLNNEPLDSVCRYRLSTGPYFEYKVFTGQVLPVKN